MTLKTCLFFLSIAILSLGCTDSGGHSNKIKDVNIALRLHESGASSQNRYPDLIRVTHQPVGAFFYKAQWQQSSKGNVKIEAGDHVATFHNVLSLVGMQDEKNTADGMFSLDLTSGITGPNGITHEAARDYIFAVLSKLRSEGWMPSIPFDDPRIRGKDMLNYRLKNGGVVLLDADYKPTIEEWVQLPRRSGWELFNNSAILTISFDRAPNPEDPAGPGIYLVSYNVTSKVNHFRGFIDPRRRDEWKTLLPEELKDLSARRRAAEAALKEEGIRIDSSYADPQIPW